jgi:membrane protein
MSAIIVLALLVVLYGGQLGDYVAAYFGFSEGFKFVWRILQWPIALFFLFVTFNLIYYFGPASRPRKKRLSMIGTVIAVILWLLVSFGFRVYLHFFDSYSVTYGSLGAVIILMLWFYFTGLAILLGGEINSELEQGVGKK